MSDVQKIQPEAARRKIQAGSALLVCAYDSDDKFQAVRLDGALSLREFRAARSPQATAFS